MRRCAKPILQIVATIRRWRHRRLGIKQLMQLKEFELRDLGIERYDIPAIIDEVLKRRPPHHQGDV